MEAQGNKRQYNVRATMKMGTTAVEYKGMKGKEGREGEGRESKKERDEGRKGRKYMF